MTKPLHWLTLGTLSQRHPAIAQMIAAIDGTTRPDQTLGAWLADLKIQQRHNLEIDADQIAGDIELLVNFAETNRCKENQSVKSITLIGGFDKSGNKEHLQLTLTAGEVFCIVGPTGSGKSRLLADIECLAQGETPTGRHVLIDGRVPDPSWRFGAGQRLIAQLAQNMNFVIDLSVHDFLMIHAESRFVDEPARVVQRVVECANSLAGEPFSAEVSVTQLSGGQSRALMIADTALLSTSPVVLIDEIENAGVDRTKALELLMSNAKIVLISTHDPILALLGGRRIVVRNGAVVDVLVPSAAERLNLKILEQVDRRLARIRGLVRAGEHIEEPLDFAYDSGALSDQE